MKCLNCNHLNDGGKFCEKCGAKLVVIDEAAAATETPVYNTQTVSTQPNVHIENAKNVSKMYAGFFMNVIKKPFSQSQHVDHTHFVNGLITVALYAIFIPLMLYLGFKEYTTYIDSPFLNVVVKPAFAYAIFILLVSVYSFAAIKLGKVNTSLQDVIARFGTFLVPFVGLFIVATIMALLQIKLFALLLFIGFIGSVFTVPPLVIASFKKEVTAGLDVVYGTILTYLATFITIGFMAKLLFEVVGSMLEDLLSSFFFF